MTRTSSGEEDGRRNSFPKNKKKKKEKKSKKAISPKKTTFFSPRKIVIFGRNVFSQFVGFFSGKLRREIWRWDGGRRDGYGEDKGGRMGIL